MGKAGVMGFSIVAIVLLLALGLPTLVRDGAESYPDVREEIIRRVFSSVWVCRDHPIHRLMIRRSKLVHLTYTEIPEEEREPFIVPTPVPALLAVPPTYTIENAIVRHFSFFAIPIGYTQVTDGEVRCARLIDLSALTR